jgi:hypothetical protein
MRRAFNQTLNTKADENNKMIIQEEMITQRHWSQQEQKEGTNSNYLTLIKITGIDGKVTLD